MQPNKSLKKLADGMESSTDGVEPLKGGGFIVSAWSSMMFHVGPDGSTHVLIDTRPAKANSADIGFDPETSTVYVPTFFKNTVIAYTLQWATDGGRRAGAANSRHPRARTCRRIHSNAAKS